MQSKQKRMIRLLVKVVFLFIVSVSCNDKEANSKGEASVEQSQKPKARTITQQTEDFNPYKNAYFGDLHVHTSWSFDAFIYNTRTTPDDAYEFGKGHAIDHATGKKIQLNRPLDFMAVTDHAEYMGVMKQMLLKENPSYNLEIAKQVRSRDRTVSRTAFGIVGTSIAQSNPIKELNMEEIRKSTWGKTVEAADRHYDPGTFTTFSAYEWTSAPGDTIWNSDGTYQTHARNLHRNVVFLGDKVVNMPFSSFDSPNPENLWDWMDRQRDNGISLLAIPHNANMSDGWMYATETFSGDPMTADYALQRMRNEPINEVTQIKGQSMSHPALSLNDEFADFEIYAYTFSLGAPPVSKPQNSYVREAYQNGLRIEAETGKNPFKFGVIGSSDSHLSGGAIEESNYEGKLGAIDGTPERRINPGNQNFVRYREFSAAGIAGVWAEENTREAIFNAMERKETFATTGTRIKMRFFAIKDFDGNLTGSDWVSNAYAQGTPMGGDIANLTKSPKFLIWAVKDSDGANLDRVQVIKAWAGDDGSVQEKIFNVVWSDDRSIGSDGKLSPVGNTVNVKEASYTNSIGAVDLKTVWTDPEFDPGQDALYYLRVLEIPTPRWSTYDAKTLGIDIPDNLDASIQERAWSSPIWYAAK